MQTINRISVVLGTLVCVTTATIALAQTTSRKTTPVPPGIAMPDLVETRLGPLSFSDGFPSDATVEKLYDNLDFQRAVQAYLLAIPAVNQAAMRKALLTWGRPTQLCLSGKILSSLARSA
jgi:hypothetical protein